jgi:hypothetical protein
MCSGEILDKFSHILLKLCSWHLFYRSLLILYELRCGHISSFHGIHRMHLMSRRVVLCNFGPIGGYRRVCSRRVCNFFVNRMLGVPRRDILGFFGIGLHQLRCRHTPSKYRSNCMHVLPIRIILRHDGAIR